MTTTKRKKKIRMTPSSSSSMEDRSDREAKTKKKKITEEEEEEGKEERSVSRRKVDLTLANKLGECEELEYSESEEVTDTNKCIAYSDEKSKT